MAHLQVGGRQRTVLVAFDASLHSASSCARGSDLVKPLNAFPSVFQEPCDEPSRPVA